jgi:RHS repeat-associated protein
MAWALDTNFATGTMDNFVASGGCAGDGIWKDVGTRPIDANGDGYADQIYSRATNKWVNINSTQKGWYPQASGWTVPETFVTTGYIDTGLRILDANGDSLPDLFLNEISGTSTQLHTGTGWSGTNSYVIPPYLSNVKFGDVNGDGLTDMVDNHDATRKVYINNGNDTGWTEDTNYVVPAAFYSAGSAVIDVNKDSLDDLFTSLSTTSVESKIYINKGDGTGWEYDSRYSIPQYLEDSSGDPGTRLADVTNDGYPDIIMSRSDDSHPSGIRKVYVNNGDGTGWSDYGSVSIPVDFASYGLEQGVRLMDVTGDGILDLAQALCDIPSQRGLYPNDGDFSDTINYPDTLTAITSPTGQATEVKYLTTPLYKNQSNELYNPHLPLVMNTVQYIATNDGFGNRATTTYSYSNGEYYFDTPLKRRFAGFASTTRTDTDGTVTKTFFHQGNDTLSSIGEYDDDFSKIGKPYRIEVRDGNGSLYSKTINKWENVDLENERDFVKLTSTVSFSFDGDADHRERATTLTYNNDSGNLLEQVDYGEVSGNDNGTFTDTGTDKRTATTTYAASTTLYILGLPSREVVVDQASSTVKETRHYYDGLSLGNVSVGNETKTEFWKSGSSYASTTKTYNAYGLPTDATDGLSNATTYTYDSFNLYPATTTNALSQSTGYQYDYSLGKPKSVIDANSRVFQTVFDGLDRPVTEKQPDQTTPSTLVTKKTYAYTDTQGSRKVVETNYLDGSTDFVLYTYLDGMGRSIQTRREAETANQYAVRDFVYNNTGLLQRESLPYFSSGTSRTTATATSSLYTRYTYDPLGRATSTANAVGTTTQAYDDWVTTITDPNGGVKKLTNDAYGRLATVVENDGTAIGTTTYAWYANDTLATTTDADGNVRNFTYDGRGLRLTAQDLHDTGDATFGTWTYSYDNAGNLTSTVDPKSQTINLTYDTLNRVLTEDYTGQAGTEIAYGYDTCTNGKTRLCTATSTGAVSSTTYTALGSAATTTTKIDNAFYTTAYRYDRLGNLTNIVYPDLSEVRYTYNTAGLPETVEQGENRGSFGSVVTDFDYGPTGQVTFKAFGNGVESTYTFDADHLYRLTNILTVAPAEEGESMSFGPGEELLLALALEKHPLAIAKLHAVQLAGVSESPYTKHFTADPVAEEHESSAPSHRDEQSVEKVEGMPEVVEVAKEEAVPDAAQLEIANQAAPGPQAEELQGEELSLEPTPSGSCLENQDLSILERIESCHVAANDLTAFKINEIAKLDTGGTYMFNGFTIAIQSMQAFDRGLEIFIKAWWPDGEPVGFGDGTVETERIRRFMESNGGHKDLTYLVVSDPEGSIVVTDQVRDFKHGEEWIDETVTFREDPLENLRRDLGHTVSAIAKHRGERIIAGKVGKTTDTYYPDAGNPGTNTVDGNIRNDPNNGSSYAVTQAAGTGTSLDPNGSTVYFMAHFKQGTNDYLIDRILMTFNTASIGSDIVSSTTLSLYDSNVFDDSNVNATSIVGYTGSATTYATADFDLLGTSKYATDIAWATHSHNAYNNFAFNATGTAAVVTSGVTKIGVRANKDLSATEPTTSNYLRYNSTDNADSNTHPKLIVEHAPTGNSAPTAPTSLLVEGTTTATDITDSSPEFSAIYNDPNTGDSAIHYRIQVSTSSSFSSVHWDSGTTSMATTSEGQRNTNISYGGPELAEATTYYWRIRFSDDDGATGAWSTATSSFSVLNAIQNISFTYDANGNILTIDESALSEALRTVGYTYDALNRLTRASTTAASSTPYRHQFAYNMLGNITGMSTSTATTTYTYAETGYANPHAVTSVGGTTNTNDNNGNVTAIGSLDYTWDWRNRLASAERSGGGVTTYGYDHTGQRVFQATGSATTSYPNRYYNVASSSLTATTTKHIFSPDGTLLATIVGSGTSTASTTYLHPDHLGGTNVATDENGEVVQTLDYYPYGSQRIATGSSDEQRRFIGEEYDGDTEFSYLNARYYQGSRGQFMSQDPAHLAIGDPAKLRGLTGLTEGHLLSDPQLLNSYSYGKNNPIAYKDPQGTCPFCPILLAGGFGAIGGIGVQAFNDFYSGDFSNRSWQDNLNAYSVAAGQGAIVGAGVAGAAIAAPFIGLTGGAATIAVGGTAGTLTAGTTLLGDYYLGRQTDIPGLVVGSGVSALTAGALKSLPKVPGRLPNFGTKAFYSGAHATRQAAEEFVSSSMQLLGQTAVGAAVPKGSSNSGPGGSDVWAVVRAAISQYYAGGGK